MASSTIISIVLPTYNRRRSLERVLAGLELQTLPKDRFEAVIVDDGSTDDTRQWLEQNSTRSYPLLAVRQQNGGPAMARNAGVAAARGDLILFLDDDVEPTPDLLAEHLSSHEAEADVVVIGTLASLAHYAQPWVAWEQAKLERQYEAMARGDWAPTFRQFWTGNASVSRQHVLGAGGFDASFLRAEDVELGRRLHERGLRFRFNPRARGLHHAERSLSAWEAMHQRYGTLDVKIYGEFGKDGLGEVLAENFSRINPATRWLVMKCTLRPRRYAAARRVLRHALELEERAKVRFGSGQICGALANLIYWEATAETVGEAQLRRIFRHGDSLRQAQRS
jgi:glycosyltransferase involved in cell wall biosynthesis